MFARLDKDMVAKVADFGFSRELVTDYYKLKRRTLLPIKWLSLRHYMTNHLPQNLML